MSTISDAAYWAGAVVCIAIPGMIIFRAPVNRLIDRISGVSKNGLALQGHQEEMVAEARIESLSEVLREPVSASMLEREKTIQKNLPDLGLNTDKDKITALVRALAIARINLEFDNFAYFIFGSQISLLINLSSGHQNTPIEQAQNIFERAKQDFPAAHQDRTFENWLGYLTSRNLVQASNIDLRITQSGTDFLKHLIDAKLAFPRSG